MKVRSHFLVPALCLFILVISTVAWAQERWVLSYGRQYGQNITAGNSLAELFAAYENGVDAQVGMTNDANSGLAVFGYTNPASNPWTPGNLRVLLDPGNAFYDFHAYDPPVPSDRSPDCYFNSPLPNSPYYKFELWWRKLSDASLYTMRPFTPAYHYDLVNSFNTATTEAPGFNSDAFSLSSWTDYHAQTFVVPANINRIIGAKAFAVRGFADPKFQITFSIRQGGPTGTQIGPAVTSREVNSNEFQNVRVTWGMEDVPVSPGGTYALRIEPPDAAGFNLYATDNNNYAGGILFNGSTAVPGRDMVGVVIGAWRNTGPVNTPTPTVPPPPTATPTQPPVGGNLLVNPGAETGDYTGWTTGPRMNIDDNVYIPDPNFHSGSHRFGLSAGWETIDTYMYQQVSVTPGHTYEAGFWLVEMDGTDEYMQMNWINGAFGGTEQNLYATTPAETHYAAWAEFCAQQFTPTSSTVTLILRFRDTVGNQTAAWHIDDIYLHEVAAPQETSTPTLPPPNTPTNTPEPPATPTNTPVEAATGVDGIWRAY